MNEGIISSRYAKALYSSAEEKKILDKVYGDVEIIYDAVEHITEFDEFLLSPAIKPSDKKKILSSIFSKKFQDITFSFLDLLVDNKRESFLHSICLRFIDGYKQNKNIKSVQLITSSPVSASMNKKVLEMIEKFFKCEGEIENKINEKIIGGFIVRVDDKQFDASIASKLKSTKEKLLNTQVDE